MKKKYEVTEEGFRVFIVEAENEEEAIDTASATPDEKCPEWEIGEVTVEEVEE